MKFCLNCNKELIPPETTNKYLKSNFRFKKFCNDECRIIYYNILKKKKYLLKNTEHDLKVIELNRLIKGKPYFSKGKKNSYNPDIIKNDEDYELEIFRKMNHLKNKVNKWDSTRKHILVVNISEPTMNLFDEVYFFSSKKDLIKEK